MTEDKFIEVYEAVVGPLEPWQESVLRVMFSAKREPVKMDGPITAQKLYGGSITFQATTSKAVTEEAVRDSACSYDARVEPEAFERWIRTHDAGVLMQAANTFVNSNPRSWGNEAAYYLEDLAKDRREGR